MFSSIAWLPEVLPEPYCLRWFYRGVVSSPWGISHLHSVIIFNCLYTHHNAHVGLWMFKAHLCVEI